MGRGRFLLLLPLSLTLGCNGLSVTPFVGTVIQMSFAAGIGPTAKGTHLELWVRNQNNDIIRVDGTYYTYPDPATKKSKTVNPFGMMIRQAITMDDPCMIDSKGNLLISPDAYKSRTTAGITETPEEQAQKVKNRIQQLLQNGVSTSFPLLGVTPYDETPLPQLAADASAADRLAACQTYWDTSPFAYTPNPAQITAPIHGEIYGFVSYTTSIPATGYDGLRIDSPTRLKGAQELWLTVENVPPEQVDVTNLGPVFLEGKPTPGGIDVIHFDLTGAVGSGTAALEVNLDDPSVNF